MSGTGYCRLRETDVARARLPGWCGGARIWAPAALSGFRYDQALRIMVQGLRALRALPPVTRGTTGRFHRCGPKRDDDMKLWVITSTNFDLDGAAERITERNDEVFHQDKPILESQRPALLPLDLYEEVHNRADKFAMYYRKWLKDLGVSDVV